jgi:hypothetical protein
MHKTPSPIVGQCFHGAGVTGEMKTRSRFLVQQGETLKTLKTLAYDGTGRSPPVPKLFNVFNVSDCILGIRDRVFDTRRLSR